MIHLDTSFLIKALVPQSSEDTQLREWLRIKESFAMSAIAWTEFLCGPLDDSSLALARRLVPSIVDYTDIQSTLAARLFNETGRRRGSMVDCMIAASAIDANAPMATANTGDFRRFVDFGLVIA
jgi:predicted nucleic acid-binding protein